MLRLVVFFLFKYNFVTALLGVTVDDVFNRCLQAYFCRILRHN